jgi:CcmD family protein
MTYLYAAFAATWIIHILYLSSLVRRYSGLRKEMEELNRNSGSTR